MAIPIDWVTEDSGAPEVPSTDRHVGGVGFTASYDAGSGWDGGATGLLNLRKR